MSFSINSLIVLFLFFLFHKLDIWPLPVPIVTLFSELTTLLFFCELGFYIYFRTHIKSLQRLSEPPSYSESNFREKRVRVFNNMLNVLSVHDYGDCLDIDSFLRQWFLFTADKPSDIRRGNLQSWLSWALFYKFPNSLSVDEAVEVNGYIDVFQQRTGILLAPGFNPHVKPMRLTLEPVIAMHRPLTLYCVVVLFQSIGKILLTRAFGFTRRRIGGFHYWYKIHSSDEYRGKLPLVFIHGLGQGLMYYLYFLSYVTDRDIFLVELSHISTRVWEHVPNSSEVVDLVETMLQEHNYNQCVLVGHSFGTFSVSWCVKQRPHLVNSVLLIDPVNLCLSFPTTCHEFVYQPPTDLMKMVRYLTVSREMGIAMIMRRGFWWIHNALFLEDIPLKDIAPPLDPAVCVGEARSHGTRSGVECDRYAYYRTSHRQSQSPQRTHTRTPDGSVNGSDILEKENVITILDDVTNGSMTINAYLQHRQQSKKVNSQSQQQQLDLASLLSFALCGFNEASNEVDVIGIRPLLTATCAALSRYCHHVRQEQQPTNTNTTSVQADVGRQKNSKPLEQTMDHEYIFERSGVVDRNSSATHMNDNDSCGVGIEYCRVTTQKALNAHLRPMDPRCDDRDNISDKTTRRAPMKMLVFASGCDDLVPSDRIINHIHLFNRAHNSEAINDAVNVCRQIERIVATVCDMSYESNSNPTTHIDSSNLHNGNAVVASSTPLSLLCSPRSPSLHDSLDCGLFVHIDGHREEDKWGGGLKQVRARIRANTERYLGITPTPVADADDIEDLGDLCSPLTETPVMVASPRKRNTNASGTKSPLAVSPRTYLNRIPAYTQKNSYKLRGSDDLVGVSTPSSPLPQQTEGDKGVVSVVVEEDDVVRNDDGGSNPHNGDGDIDVDVSDMSPVAAHSHLLRLVASLHHLLRRVLTTRIMYQPDFGHGHILFNGPARDNTLGAIRWLADED